MSQSKFTASERADKCVLSLEQAIYQTTKRERGLVGAICSIYGLNYNTVSAQINPNNDSHTLSPDIIEYVLTHAQNKSLVMDAICCAHGNAAWFELPTADDGEMFDDIAELMKRFADMNNTTLAAIADQKVTNDESRAMKKVGYALIAQIQKVILTAEAMERIV
ncbi:phage regulatory CII family protein [Mesorhizobium sp. ISC15]